MMRSDDPLKDFWEYSNEQEDWLEKRPVCDQCGEHIQDDHYYFINGETLCESCMYWYKKWID